jgi:hypothetical protein
MSIALAFEESDQLVLQSRDDALLKAYDGSGRKKSNPMFKSSGLWFMV